jgi:hypothetical protein
MTETYNCDKCNTSYKSKNALILHLTRSKFHKEIVIVEDKNICEYCQRSFDFPSVLKRHIEVCPNKYIVLYNNIKDEFESFKQTTKYEYDSIEEKTKTDFE